MAKVIKRGSIDSAEASPDGSVPSVSRRAPVIERSTVEAKSQAQDIRARAQAEADEILDNARKMMEASTSDQFVLIIDSLQCLDDGMYKSGKITSNTAIRCLEQITDFCKETGAIGLVINQVNKSGKMAGSNKLKHMVDAHMHLSVEKKETDLIGCRVLEVQKNRFGGCGHIYFLTLGKRGFRQVAKVSAN